jgi:hypothetical protein
MKRLTTRKEKHGYSVGRYNVGRIHCRTKAEAKKIMKRLKKK